MQLLIMFLKVQQIKLYIVVFNPVPCNIFSFTNPYFIKKKIDRIITAVSVRKGPDINKIGKDKNK